MQSVELLQKEKVDFNILCVLSQANVEKARGVVQVLSKAGHRQPAIYSAGGVRARRLARAVHHHAGAVRDASSCDLFEVWWPDRRRMRIRCFDNIAEAVAGQKPGNCTMHETCDSYVVVEYNGDVYPCDFFVESGWKLGNVNLDTWRDIARRTRRHSLRGEEGNRAPRVPGLRISIAVPRRLPEVPPWTAGQLRRSRLLLPGLQDDLRQECRAPAQGLAAPLP